MTQQLDGDQVAVVILQLDIGQVVVVTLQLDSGQVYALINSKMSLF